MCPKIEIVEGDVRHVGRPRANIDLSRVRELAAMQLSIADIAGCLGVSRRCLFARMKNDPNTRAAYQRGLAEGILKAADVIFKSIENGNVKAALYFLRVKGGWASRKPAAATKGEATS